MDTLKADVLNPKAIKLLRNLAELNLISIQDIPKTGFQDVLNRLRSKNATLTLEEISAEVEIVRAKRYAK